MPQKQKTSKKNSLQNDTFHIPPWAIYAVIALTAIVYFRSFFNGFVNLDDDIYLFDNPYSRNFSFDTVKAVFTSFYDCNYFPLTLLAYMFEYQLFGLSPMPYHVINVLLHLINTFLVYKLIERLSGKSLTALLVSVLFAIHPMHVESVAWTAELKDVLYTVFYLGSLLLYMKYLQSGFQTKHYVICLLLFILSLLSKSASVTLPVILIAVDLYKNRKLNLKMLLEKLPFFALSLLFGILAILSQEEAMKEVSTSFSLVDRIFFFSYSISFYIVKLVVPFHLSAMHYYPDGGVLPWYFYASLPFLLAMVWLAIRGKSFRREKIFGAMFFLIAISIMLQVISVGDTITSERYTYVAYIGLFFIAGQWVSNIQKISLKKLVLVGSGIIILIFSFVTWQRIGVWKDGITLFNDVVKKYPGKYPAYWMRGNIYYKKNDYTNALNDYNKSIQLFDGYGPSRAARGKVLLKGFHDYKAALEDLNVAIRLDSSEAEMYSDRGMAYSQTGDTAAGMRDFNKAISMNPNLSKAYANRAVLKVNMGNLNGGLEDINKAVSMDPKDSEALRNRGGIKNILKDYNGALEDCNSALQINPRDNIALFNRGHVKFNLKDINGACNDWHQSLELGYTPAESVIQQFCR
ncbi:MAG TPA: tetratricopeptide repeat protein [Bacteroidales bacterium]|nr:tetratricopeptide repeat protein [Bacteroidales bacterium]